MNVFDQQAGSRLKGSADASVTVDAGFQVTRIIWCADTSAGSVVITPKGPNTVSPPTALPTLTVPANSGWMGLSFLPGELGPTSTIVFTGTAAQYVFFNKLSSGA